MVALKDNFGFLKSDRRKEEVYFHYSHVVFLEDQTDWNDDYTLAEGQDMEFLVVTEPDDGNATNGAGGGTASSGGERWKNAVPEKYNSWKKVPWSFINTTTTATTKHSPDGTFAPSSSYQQPPQQPPSQQPQSQKPLSIPL